MTQNTRLQGLILTFIGFGFAAFDWDYTLAQAQHGATSVSFGEGFIACFDLGFLGLLIAVCGDRTKTYSKGLKGRKLTMRDFFIVAPCVIPGLLAYYFLKTHLETFGYHFDF